MEVSVCSVFISGRLFNLLLNNLPEEFFSGFYCEEEIETNSSSFFCDESQKRRGRNEKI
jgi:hypothetical protein